ncbi:quinoprotein dehydrogenase-associated SoxYZ-like carrier [Hyphomicrobium sp.]|uniref:quinoprotein dehydrogenase-associated SoxYZ-like carrier n=1 Tax=Hyphomicrobium sp. TaxID=82 RepID=UPI0022C38FD4|nr:quinoprotein dehydrogenase-associated SoxYZ-like carrier [Hyphomicrobium sp.]MCZ7594581.1 quinoprotein dehydrogenase-associated SoxYZ-like carrier [Hyphomicrobium sp.]
MTVLVLGLLLGCLPAKADPPPDPLKSPMWKDMVRKLLADAPVEFDDRVKVIVPTVVENQAQVPITADARALGTVLKLVVFADLNPLQHVLTLTPTNAAPYISFRMKIEQATPIRAAAMTPDGVWHVGGVFLEAAGGGCSAPATARKDADWSVTVGQAQGRMWREADGLARARFRVRHPMDTGLAKDNTPAYFIERLDMRAQSGEPLATLEMLQPVSEDPTLTLLLRLPANDARLDIEGRDNNGAIYRSRLPASWRQSVITSPVAPC